MQTENKNPFRLLVTIFSILSALTLVYLVYVVNFSPDAIDRKNNVPETGWGVLINMIIFVPLLVIFLSLTLMFVALYYVRKKRNEKHPDANIVDITPIANDSSDSNSTI